MSGVDQNAATDGNSDPFARLPEGVSPPQANGELLFDAPWQGRTFGMVHTLVDSGRFSWDEFREQLIKALDGGAAPADVYYERFLLALERCAAAADLCDVRTLDARSAEFAARPHGHDHVHSHDQSHDHSHDHSQEQPADHQHHD